MTYHAENNTFSFNDVAVGIFGIQIGPATLTVHEPEKCAGRACAVHSPSEHHMRDWPINYRGDKGMSERICPHGVGHPDTDDLAWHVSEGRGWASVHGCDGCCAPEETA